MRDDEDTLFLPQENGNVARILSSLTKMALKNHFLLTQSENKMSLNHENWIRSVVHEAFLIQTLIYVS